MRKYLMKKLAFLLSIVLVVSLFAKMDVLVFADGTSIDQGDYYLDQEAGEKICYLGEANSYTNITVPAGCRLFIDNVSVSADNMTIASGATLEILGEWGGLNCPNIEAESGALMVLESKDNTPTGIGALYDIIYNEETGLDEEIDILTNPGVPEWSQATFCYKKANEEAEEFKWYVQHDEGSGEDTYKIFADANTEMGKFEEATQLPEGVTKEGTRPIIYSIPKNTTGTLRLNIIPNEGYEIDSVKEGDASVQWRVDGNNIAYYEFDLASLSGDVTISADFKSSGGESGGGDSGESGGQTSTPSETIEAHEYAYYVATSDPNPADTFKNYLATEIWNEYFNPATGRPYAGQFGITTLDILKDKIALEPKSAEEDTSTNLYYYPYTVTLTGADANATGNAYILENDKDFIVKTGNTYNIVTENGSDIYVKGSGEVKVFGNGTCTIGTLETDSDETNGWHVTQEHSGLSIGNIGCRLIVCTDEFKGVSIIGDRNAAAWDFMNASVYDTGAESDPAIANVYYGSASVTLDEISFSNQSPSVAVSEITVDTTKLSADAVNISVNGGIYTIGFQTGYDKIPLVVKFNNNETRYITINRVGLNIGTTNISGGAYDIWHGSDHTVNYHVQETTTGKAVYATFYYQGDTAPDAADRVSLFTTVTTTTGVERKVVDTPVTTSGTIVGSGDLGKASQGTDKYYDDFLIWAGTDAEYASLKKIEAIVYDEGDDTSFDGVKVGSGTGVTWSKAE